MPNACDDGVCSPAGGGDGVCAAGPIDRFCDTAVRANGEGFIYCFTNADCQPDNIGIAGGNCSLAKPRECFLDPVAASGAPSATDPLLAAAYCVPRTSSPAIDTVNGLPGPVRETLQASAALYCAGNPAAAYPGCP